MLHIYNEEEVQAIFAVIQIFREWLWFRNCAIVALMLDLGLRQNEVCSINIEDMFFRDSLIKIHGKGNKERLVPIGKLTQQYATQL